MAEQPKLPALADIVQPPSPVFLRKVGKKSDWGSDDTPQDERVSDVIDLVFSQKTYPYSVYLVCSDEELRRVIIGMNGGRESLSSESYFISLHRHELQAAGIQIDHTPGAGITRCRFANSLHHDLSADHDQLRSLCLHLFQQGSKVIYISKGKTKLLIPKAEADGCLTIPKSIACSVEICA